MVATKRTNDERAGSAPGLKQVETAQNRWVPEPPCGALRRMTGYYNYAWSAIVSAANFSAR